LFGWKSVCCVLTVDSSVEDELQPADVDWEQLLAVTFDPAADAMLLGAADEMFSLNRNDVLYAQKYAATRTSAVAPPAEEGALNDRDLERCANDLDRFVNDLELACANIGQRGETEVVGELPTKNARGHDLDLNTDPDHIQIDNLDPCQRISSVNDQGHAANIDLGQGHGTAQPSDDLRAFEAKYAVVDENRLQDADRDDRVDKHDHSTEQNDSQRAVLSDLDPSDLKVNNGPEIAMCELTTDPNTVHCNYPCDPDPEATVV